MLGYENRLALGTEGQKGHRVVERDQIYIILMTKGKNFVYPDELSLLSSYLLNISSPQPLAQTGVYLRPRGLLVFSLFTSFMVCAALRLWRSSSYPHSRLPV